MATLQRYPAYQKFCRKCTVFKISIFVFCNFCEKFENSKWPHFWQDKKFWKIQMATPERCPVGQTFRRNCSISHGFRDIIIFVLCKICENSKWLPFLVRQIFLEISRWLHCRDTLWVKNFVKIALSRTVFEIQAFLCFAIFAENSITQNGRHLERQIFLKKLGWLC